MYIRCEFKVKIKIKNIVYAYAVYKRLLISIPFWIFQWLLLPTTKIMFDLITLQLIHVNGKYEKVQFSFKRCILVSTLI